MLAVADPHPAHHFLVNSGRRLAARGWRLRIVPYSRVRDVPADRVRAAVLFFPHLGWDAGVESLPGQLYGSPAHGLVLRAILHGVGAVLRNRMLGLRFLNSPEAIALTRDKSAVKRCWLTAGISTPQPVEATTAAELSAAVAEFGRVYVKVPCGSMNKGMTVLTPTSRRTNFVYNDGRLRSPQRGHPQYGGPDKWLFTEVDPSDDGLLHALCTEPGLVMERGIADEVTDGRRIELRVTVLGGRVVDTTIGAAPAGSPTTAPHVGDGTPRLPEDALRGAHRVARQAARALGLRYAVLDIVLGSEHLRPYAIDVQAFPAPRTPLSVVEAMLELLVEPAQAIAARRRARPTAADRSHP